MDFNSMAAALGMEEDDFKELAELFVTTSLSDMEKLEKGIAAKNADQVAQAAHSIKGAAGNLGFMDIYTIAAKAETSARQGLVSEVEDEINSIKNGLNAITAALKISK